jgi:hypothetical protein
MQADLAAAPYFSAYEELKRHRTNYARLFFLVLVLSWFLSGCMQVLSTSAEQASETEGDEEANPLSVSLIIMGLLPSIAIAALSFVYAEKIGHPSPIGLALLALVPIFNWISFFIIVGYVPQHLKEFEPPHRPASLLWVVIGFVPLILMALLFFLNPDYMAQLFLGPPIGAYIPGLLIPCGWVILALLAILIALANFPLWLGFQKGMVRGGWRILLVLLVCIYILFPSLYLVILGPAAVQAFVFMQGG